MGVARLAAKKESGMTIRPYRYECLIHAYDTPICGGNQPSTYWSLIS